VVDPLVRVFDNATLRGAAHVSIRASSPRPHPDSAGAGIQTRLDSGQRYRTDT
jgi:hypothetical protein